MRFHIPVVTVIVLLAASVAAQTASDTKLSGTVSRSDEDLGALTIQDPGVVTLINIQATSISFVSSSRRMIGDRRAAPTRVTIRDSKIAHGGVRLSSEFPGMEVTIERSTITGTNASSSDLLYVHAMSGGSFTVRDSIVSGRKMFHTQSTISNATLLFQNTSFSATECASSACASDTHFNFHGQVAEGTRVTFDESSIRSTVSTITSGSRTAIQFASLNQSTVTINAMNAYMQHRAGNTFVHVSDSQASCVTIANSTVTQACTEGSTSRSACASAKSYILKSDGRSTANSFLTLDNVKIHMYKYDATALYVHSARNLDIVMNKITAVVDPHPLSAFFAFESTPDRTTVAMLDSKLTMSSGFVYKFPSSTTHTSLLNVGNTFNAFRVMIRSVTGLNAKQGCNTFQGGSSNAHLGSNVGTCAINVYSPCIKSSSVYSALGISSNPNQGPVGSPSGSDGSGNVLWIVGAVLGGCVVVAACIGIGCCVCRCMCSNDEEDGTDDKKIHVTNNNNNNNNNNENSNNSYITETNNGVGDNEELQFVNGEPAHFSESY